MPDTSTSAPTIRVGGMLVGYYLLCERKAWLSMRGLWMEQESGRVALGRLAGESSYQRKQKELMLTAEAPAGSPAAGTPLVGKIDWAALSEGVLHETKLSRSTEDAHRWQLRFYLWLLKLTGTTRAGGEPFRGELNYPKLRRTEAVELLPEHEARLEEIVAGLRRVAERETPPARIDQRSFCKKCAFEELCYA
jgi:CRISPR-associated exonuclease Cas4